MAQTTRQRQQQAQQASPTSNLLGGGGCGCGCLGILIALFGVMCFIALTMEIYMSDGVWWAGLVLLVTGLLMATIGVIMYIASLFVA